MPIDTMKTGAVIAAYRQRMNLSQQGLAGLMNVTHQAVSKWEKGLALPDTETLLALAKLFGTTMEELLTGVLPQEPEPIPEAAPVQEESSEPVPAAEIGQLDFSSIMGMLPFVSTRVAEQLFINYASAAKPDGSKLTAIAPFVSTQVLNDYIVAHPLSDISPEVLAGLAPFLPTQTVDQMILGMKAPLPQHAFHMLMPFASAKVVDHMVLGTMGLAPQKDAPETPNTQPTASHRESPRLRMLRKAIETNNTVLLDQFCEDVSDLDANAQFELAQHLLQNRLYSQLAEVLEEADEDVQHRLVDMAFESNDPELLHLLSEHLD